MKGGRTVIKPKILVVGSMNMDLMVYGVPKIPNYGESVLADSYSYSTGGKGSNQAIAAALQGAEVTMVGKVGDDENGHILIKELQMSGVNTDYVVVDPDTQTGLAPIMVEKDGKYVCYVVMGGNNRLRSSDVEKVLNEKEFDMVMMQLEMPLETVYQTYELASKKKIPVFLDAGPAMSIPLHRLKGIYIMSPNESETKALTGISVNTEDMAVKAARKLYEEVKPQYVILKMGSRGALLYNGVDAKMIHGFKVEAVDSTAAGDTFGAALVIQLCKGIEIEKATVFAHAAAAICVSRKGAQRSIPAEKEVQEFLKNKEREGTCDGK